MNKKQKKTLIRIIIAAVLLVVIAIVEPLIESMELPFQAVPLEKIVSFVLYLIPYLVIGCDILKKAFKGI